MNKEQIKAFSNFYMDVAKGIVVGLFGYSVFTTETLLNKFIWSILGLLVAYFLIKMALDYLSGDYDN